MPDLFGVIRVSLSQWPETAFGLFLSVCPGGAAVTEEIIPGYKFSRASYVLSLLRPQIFADLDLKKHGLKVTKPV